MRVIESQVVVEGVSAHDLAEFMLTCTDEAYQAWWPGVHRQFHTLARGPRADHVGDVVEMDEDVGRRHLRLAGVVEHVVPDRSIGWQLFKRVPLPVHLRLDLIDVEGGILVRHTLTAGWSGVGRLVDPLLRLYFSRRFATALERHVQTEFPRLATYLAGRQADLV